MSEGLDVRTAAWLLVILWGSVGSAFANESPAVLATLTRQNAATLAPQGRESDWIYGDLVMRNEHLVAVIARPVAGRSASWTVPDAGCTLIDLANATDSKDLLTVLRPGGEGRSYRAAKGQSLTLSGEATGSDVPSFRCVSAATEGQPEITLEYRLVGDVLEVETLYANRGDAELSVELVDLLRAEETFQKAGDASGAGLAPFFWAYDRWSGSAYGVSAEPHQIRFESDWRRSLLHYEGENGSTIRLAPGQGYRIVRRIRAAGDLLGLVAQRQRAEGVALHELRVHVTDPSGPVEAAELRVELGGRGVGSARTDAAGDLALSLPAGRYTLRVSAPGRGQRDSEIELPSPEKLSVQLPAAAWIEGEVRDGRGEPIAAKLQFLGVAGTKDPDFGPAQGERAVHNAYYSPDGRFRRAVAPGRYRVIASHGPEFDAFQKVVVVRRGERVKLAPRLRRSVDSRGWISADMHGHSTESGDTSASQRGRVLNLLAEQIEFAPATEHNRISSYAPHLKALGAEALMATAPGVELTGEIPMNHQNAFPLALHERTQSGGAPLPGDPEAQIRRLALYDGGSERLVQQNHPDLFQILYDRDRDGVADGGYAGMLPYIDVMEIYPLARFLNQEHDEQRDSPMLLWLQLLNRGERIPAVINTDAHSNFHGSGPRRTYVRSEQDDPGKLDPLEIIRELKRGHAVMTTGPYLEVAMQSEAAAGSAAIPGDDLFAPEGRVDLSVRVQCPNWFDVDRVQVLINGRMPPELNFTRESDPEHFFDTNVRFASVIPLQLDEDAHVVVIAAGQKSRLGMVMGRQNAGIMPIAVSNPIFVDVDGGGFTANHDRLGVELPRGAPWPSAPLLEER